MKLSALSLVRLVLCNMCIVCKLIWLKQCQTGLHLRKVNISLGSSDVLCSLYAELIFSASSCSVHMVIASEWLAERALLFLNKVAIPLFCKVHIWYVTASAQLLEQDSGPNQKLILNRLWYEASTTKAKRALASSLGFSSLPDGLCQEARCQGIGWI